MAAPGLYARLALVLAAAIASPALAQDDEAPKQAQTDADAKAWFEQQVAALNSDDFKTRDSASKEIASDARVTLRMIEQRLVDDAHPLNPEQTLRLSEAGIKMFGATQRGAMGVSFATMYSDSDGVKVGGTVDGFDSKRVLKPGDVIREMDGVNLSVGNPDRAHSLIISLIISHDPGEEVTMSVLRAGEPVVVRMRLGNYRDLRQANPLDPGRMAQAWDFRLTRVKTGKAEGPGAAETAEPGISAQRWAQVSDSLRRGLRRLMSPQQQQANPFIVPSQPDPQGDDPSVTLVAGGSMRQLSSEPPGDFSASERGMRGNARAQQLQQQIDALNATIKVYQQKLRDPNIPDATRRQLAGTIQQYQQIVKQYRDDRKRLLGTVEP